MHNKSIDFNNWFGNVARLGQHQYEYVEDLMAEGHYRSAVDKLDQMIEHQPNSAIAWYSRGNALAHLEHYQEALASFDRAIEINPDFYAAWTFRGVMLIYLDQPAEALCSCEKALEIYPQHSEAWVFRGVALHRLGYFREAYTSYDTAMGKKRQSIWQKLPFSHLLRAIRWHPKTT